MLAVILWRTRGYLFSKMACSHPFSLVSCQSTGVIANQISRLRMTLPQLSSSRILLFVQYDSVRHTEDQQTPKEARKQFALLATRPKQLSTFSFLVQFGSEHIACRPAIIGSRSGRRTSRIDCIEMRSWCYGCPESLGVGGEFGWRGGIFQTSLDLTDVCVYLCCTMIPLAVTGGLHPRFPRLWMDWNLTG